MHDLEVFANVASDWFWMTDEELRFTYFSDRLHEASGEQVGQIGKTRMELAANIDDRSIWDPHLEDLKNRRSFRNFTYPYCRSDGSVRWFRVNGEPHFDDQGVFKGYRGSCTDVTVEVEATLAAEKLNTVLQAKIEELTDINVRLEREIERRRALEKKLVVLARTDELTGLLNRRALLESGHLELQRLKRRICKYPPLTVLLDIDHFKSINDEFGHAVGDIVIADLAECIRSSIRSTDVAGRIGGEEFAIILYPARMEGGQVVLNRITELFAKAGEKLGFTDREFTVSGGVASMSENDESFTDSLEKADEALYRAKRAGRNRIISYS